MKITRTAEGKATIKLSHKEWSQIGRQTGWLDDSDLSTTAQVDQLQPLDGVQTSDAAEGSSAKPKTLGCEKKGCKNVFTFDPSNPTESYCDNCRGSSGKQAKKEKGIKKEAQTVQSLKEAEARALHMNALSDKLYKAFKENPANLDAVREALEGIKTNAKWIEEKIQPNVNMYDAGQGVGLNT
jgi:hypothetical protein